MCSSNQYKSSVVRTSHHISEAANLVSLDETMKQFWEFKSVPTPASSVMLSSEDAQCEEHFLNTFSRYKIGRFMVGYLSSRILIVFPDHLILQRSFSFD